jgi:hypothetical protein
MNCVTFHEPGIASIPDNPSANIPNHLAVLTVSPNHRQRSSKMQGAMTPVYCWKQTFQSVVAGECSTGISSGWVGLSHQT